MPLFELDDGRPRLVQPMQPLPGSFAQDLGALLTHHLTAIAGEPLFPVRHRAGAPDHLDLPELLALDATGRAVVVEGVQVLDDDAVVTALRHAGAAARMTATDLARSYHADPDRFAVDFAAFRDQVAFGMATSRREGVRLLIVCSEVATEAGDTLGYLRGPGRHVDVLQLGVVRGVDDRRFLDVSPLARHENVRRPVEPTALRLVRSSEASFATAMAYDEGRRRPPVPSGSTHPGPGYGSGSGLPSTSAFPSGSSARSSSPTTRPASQGRPVTPPAGRPGMPPPPPPRSPSGVTTRSTGPTTSATTSAATTGPAAPGRRSGSAVTPAAPVTPAAAVLPVAGAPSVHVSTSTRAVPAVIPPSGQSAPRSASSSSASQRPGARSYTPPVNRASSSYSPPPNPTTASMLLTGPAVPPVPPAPSSSARSGQGPASRSTSTAPVRATPEPGGTYPATASPLYESMSGLLAGQAPVVGRADTVVSSSDEPAYDERSSASPEGRVLDEPSYDDLPGGEVLHDDLGDEPSSDDEPSRDEPDGLLGYPPHTGPAYEPVSTFPALSAALPVVEQPAAGRPSVAQPAAVRPAAEQAVAVPSLPTPTLPAPTPRRPDEPYPELATLAKQRRAVVTLVWLRERRGQRLVATLTPDGAIELPDGAQFFEPGEAAAYAAGTPLEVDGWRAWRLGDGGPTLAEAAGRHD